MFVQMMYNKDKQDTERKTDMRFGFIGVGAMGGALARNLIRAGKDILIYDLSPEAVEKTLSAGTSGKAVQELNAIAAADVVFTSLPRPDHLETVMLGNTGLLSSMKKGAIYIDVSTIDPGTARKLSDACDEVGIKFLECPLGKTPADAEKAEEPIFVGGKKATYEEVKSVLEIIGSPVVYVGDVEASCGIKLISNLIGMANLSALAEGIKLGKKAGIEPDRLLELLDTTGAKSFQMDVRGPWIAQDDFNARFASDLALKDVSLGYKMAEDWGVTPHVMKATLAYLNKAVDAGYDKEDCNAIYKIIE